MQIEILLKSLCLSYYQYNSNISTLIAVDIWSQLSDYAKDTIINHFECENEELLAFVQSINDDCPDDHICNYQTQREMMENADATTSDILCDAVKLSHRRYSLKYKKYDGIIIHLQHVKIEKRNATEFVAVDENGNEYCFREEWINSIIKE